MRIGYSPRASDDLDHLRQYLAERSPQGAVHVMASIFAAIEFIRRFPDAAEATRLPGIRAKVVPRYRYKIFYRIFLAEETVQILHVRHTSREPWDQWEKEE